jgi:hypothetical protein
VDSDITLRYSGVYFGWSSVSLPKQYQDMALLDEDWHESLIYIAPLPTSSASVIQKKTIKVHILTDFDGVKCFDAKLSVMMMGFLRPIDTSTHGVSEDLEIAQAHFLQDSTCAVASLARPDWVADATLARVKSAASERTMGERYVDARAGVQKSVDKVPMHRLGVRTEGAEMRDRLVGRGGVWVKR